MSISVSLEAFDGPLDLLLHLIEKNKIDIFDIPIVEITRQYMEIISQMDTRDMDIMSDFLLMAATLLKIKSKMLLPVEKDEEEEEDPRQELVERLLEYKMYKYASLELKDLQVDAAKQLFKPSTIPEEVADFQDEVDVSELLSDVTLAKLQRIFRGVMRKQIDKIGKIEKEQVSLPDRMVYIEEYARKHRQFNFRVLLEQQADKMMVIVSFLGILELMKVGCLKIVQENIFDDIWITWQETGEQQERLAVQDIK